MVLEKGVEVGLKTAVVRRQRVKVKVGLKTAVGWRRCRHGESRDRRGRIVVGDGNVLARREGAFVACRSPRRLV